MCIRDRCQLLPTLMMASDGESEMSVNINSGPCLNAPTNNIYNYVEALETLVKLYCYKVKGFLLMLIFLPCLGQA